MSDSETLLVALNALEDRLVGRADNALRTAATHPDWTARMESGARASAYRTALSDLRETLLEIAKR